MNRFFPLLALLMAVPASAGDYGHGKSAFTSSCSQCHVAQPAQFDVKGAKPTDNLATWLDAHTSRQLREWVKDPWAVNPKTQCDPRQLKPQDVDDLLSFLRSAKVAQKPASSAP